MKKSSLSAAEILTITPLINQKDGKNFQKKPIDLAEIQKHASQFMEYSNCTPGQSPLQPTYNRSGSRLNSTLKKIDNPSLVPVFSKSQYKRKVQTPIKITSIQDGVRGTKIQEIIPNNNTTKLNTATDSQQFFNYLWNKKTTPGGEEGTLDNSSLSGNLNYMKIMSSSGINTPHTLIRHADQMSTTHNAQKTTKAINIKFVNARD